MAYQYDPNLDPNLKDQEGAAPTLSGGSQLMSGSQQAGSAPGTPGRSDRFQNLNDYLSANSGGSTGSNFAGKVQGDVNQAQTAQQSAGQKFQEASDRGATRANQSIVNQAISNPTDFIKNQNNVSEFQKQFNAEYKGPRSYGDLGGEYQQAAGATQKARNVAQQAGTEGGRFALLDQYFGGGRPQGGYSQGQKSLDNLLIQNDATTQGSIQQARQNANAAQQSFQQQQKDLGGYAAGNVASTQAAKDAARGALGVDNSGNAKSLPSGQRFDVNAPKGVLTKGVTSTESGPGRLGGANVNFSAPPALQGQNALPHERARLQNQLEQTQAKAKANYEALFNAPNPKDYARTMGLPNIYAPDIKPYLREGINPTLGDVTTSQEQARLRALEQLAGLQQTEFSGTPGSYNADRDFYQLDPLATDQDHWTIKPPETGGRILDTPGFGDSISTDKQGRPRGRVTF